jgi:WhiB family transcriptional regulator, redox-sensing transcriptional regulator
VTHSANQNPQPDCRHLHSLQGPGCPWHMPGGWTELAACLYTDPELWFPERGERNDDAKKICGTCPVRVPCLDVALENHEQYGVWGGLDTPERKKLARDRRAAAA